MVQQPLSNDTKKAMFSQFLGFGLDAYDMAMVVVLAPILTKLFIAPGGSVAVHQGSPAVLDHDGGQACGLGIFRLICR